MKLVLLPGLDGTVDLLAPLIAAFAGTLDVIAVSYPTDRVLDYKALEALVRELLPRDEPYVLLGESFSGPIAVSIAASAPAQLRGVILCCSFVRNPLPALSCFSGMAGLLPSPALVPAAITSWLLMGTFSTASLRASLRTALAQVSPDVLRARVKAVLTVDVRAELKHINVPLTYLRAVHDRTVPASAAELVRKIKPVVRVTDINAPHFLLQTVPAEAVKCICSFMDDVR